jgi:antitoxin (DNA-binding transcriptional repressor) of toxin-antitoxin stability system
VKTIEMKSHGSAGRDTRDARREPFVLTVGGRPVAALVPLKNADIETATLSTDPRFLALIERSRSRQRRREGYRAPR